MKDKEFYEENVPVPFEHALLRSGLDIELKTGVFTITRAGTYFFSFSGIVNYPVKSSYSPQLVITLYKNDEMVTFSGSDGVKDGVKDQNRDLLTLQTMLNLLPYDEITLRIYSKSPDSYFSYVTFMGWMLEEKLSESLVAGL